MTPSQEALKAYVIAKMSEGKFYGLEGADVLKKALVEFGADVPQVLGDLFGSMVGQMAVAKVNDIMTDVAKRGVFTVLGELREALGMQYQRGIERTRRRARK